MGPLEREQVLHYHDVEMRLKRPVNIQINEEKSKLIAENRALKKELEEAYGRLGILTKKDENLHPIHRIINLISNTEGLSCAELTSQRRLTKIVLARQIGFYLAKKFTNKSFPEIGRRFGGRDHTTVMYGIKKITNIRKDDLALHNRICWYEQQLQTAMRERDGQTV